MTKDRLIASGVGHLLLFSRINISEEELAKRLSEGEYGGRYEAVPGEKGIFRYSKEYLDEFIGNLWGSRLSGSEDDKIILKFFAFLMRRLRIHASVAEDGLLGVEFYAPKEVADAIQSWPEDDPLLLGLADELKTHFIDLYRTMVSAFHATREKFHATLQVTALLTQYRLGPTALNPNDKDFWLGLHFSVYRRLKEGNTERRTHFKKLLKDISVKLPYFRTGADENAQKVGLASRWLKARETRKELRKSRKEANRILGGSINKIHMFMGQQAAILRDQFWLLIYLEGCLRLSVKQGRPGSPDFKEDIEYLGKLQRVRLEEMTSLTERASFYKSQQGLHFAVISILSTAIIAIFVAIGDFPELMHAWMVLIAPGFVVAILLSRWSLRKSLLRRLAQETRSQWVHEAELGETMAVLTTK